MDERSDVRFACDAMLGGFARWLRAAGYDAAWQAAGSDRDLIDFARREGPTLLTSATHPLSPRHAPPSGPAAPPERPARPGPARTPPLVPGQAAPAAGRAALHGLRRRSGRSAARAGARPGAAAHLRVPGALLGVRALRPPL